MGRWVGIAILLGLTGMIPWAAAAGGGSQEAMPSVAQPDPQSRAERIRGLVQQREYEQALGEAEAWLEGITDERWRAEAHTLAGEAAAKTDQDERARAHLREALESGADLAVERRIELLTQLGVVESNLSDFEAARGHLDRARALWETTGDSQLGARLFDALAIWHSYRGDAQTALELRERALALGKAVEDTGLEKELVAHLGQTHMVLHNYADALVYLRRSLELTAPGDKRALAVAHASIGICQFELNRLDEAEKSFLMARILAEQAESPLLAGWATGELGLVAWQRHDAEAAMALFDRAIAVNRELGNIRNEAVWWTNKGMVRRDQKRYAEALDYYHRAERLLSQGHHPPPNLYKHMGQSHAGLGNHEEALGLFAKAIAGAKAAGDRKVLWEANRELARLRVQREDWQRADEAYRAALEAVEEMRRVLLLPPVRSDFFRDKAGLYEEYIDFLVERGRPVEALEVSERARARAFLESLAEARAGLHRALPSEWLDREQILLDDISRLQAELRDGRGTADTGALVESKEKALEDLYLEVRTSNPRWYALHAIEPHAADEIREGLTADEQLLSFQLGKERSHWWLLSRDRIEHGVLPPRAELERRVRRGYAALQDPANETDALAALGEILLGPVDPLLNEAGRLIIVPSGILHYFPLGALATPSGGFLARQLDISYWPSGSTMVELRDQTGPAASEQVLVVGNPVLRETADRLRSAGLERVDTLGSLPHTEVEVNRIAELFGPERSIVLTGAAATEENLKALPLDSFSVIHLATHGWVADDEATRSGLVLSAASGGREDGLLQFREIVNLSLDADLVTLSACQSALGELVTGEGMVGLTRAFLHAGAGSVVASLWNVDDEASAELMSHFYEGLTGGLDKASALRQARISMLESERFAHPYYWAGFVLVGDSGPLSGPLPTQGDDRRWLIGMVLFVIALLVLWGVRRQRTT